MACLPLGAVTNPPKSWWRQPSKQYHPPISRNSPILKSTSQPTSYFLCCNDGPMDSTTYASVLDSCTSPIFGKSIHAHVIKSGFHRNEFVETKLLQMYGRCECLDDAQLLFDKMPMRNLYSWLAIISVYVDYDLFEEAFLLFLGLLYQDVSLDFFVFPIVLKICSGLQEIGLGRQIHGFVIKAMFVSNIYVGNALIDMYGKCGKLSDAKMVFCTMSKTDLVSWNSLLSACALNGMVHEALENLDKMSHSGHAIPNVVSWSAVISGLAQNGYAIEAIELLSRMEEEGVKPNAQTIAGALPAFAELQSLTLAREIHAYVARHGYMINPIVVNGLLDVYRRCGDMERSCKIFSRYSVKNVVSYNTMIVGFCENGEISKAEDFFDQIEQNGIQRDLITWNAMISGYVDNLLFQKAIKLYEEMQMVEGIQVDSYSLGSALSACSEKGCLRKGKQVHGQAIIKGLNTNPFVAEALMEMYFKNQDVKSAQQAFEEVTCRDIETWNSLISGYARWNQMDDLSTLLKKMRQDGFDPNIYTWNGVISGHVENGHYEVALQCFSKLPSANLKPDVYTIGTILPTCSKLATIERGKQVHGYSIRCGYDSDVYIGAGLVDMYAKCGSIKHAVRANSRILKHNLVSQNAMLTAYAMHGLGEEGITLFQHMLANGFSPDEVTFLAVLSSCAHAGEVEMGQKNFDLMQYYNLSPSLKHYTSMVDLLSRCGKTDDAYKLIRTMPMDPDSVTWGALLGGCVNSGDVEHGEIAAEKLLELEPENTGNFVLLANLYAYAGRWRDLLRIRKIITEKRMRKKAGCSWIEDGNDVHVFTANDTSHMRNEEIYTILENLTMHMKMPLFVTSECT